MFLRDFDINTYLISFFPPKQHPIATPVIKGLNKIFEFLARQLNIVYKTNIKIIKIYVL